MEISVMNMILDLGENMKYTMTLTLCMMPLKNTKYRKYIHIYEPTNDAKDLVKGNIIVYLSDNG